VLTHPNIDPIAFSIGPLSVRWYGLMYLAGFAIGWWLGLKRISRGQSPITRQQLDDLLFLIVLGVILGGRLGYVLFYKPDYYLSHPLEIFAIWQGGMSFHGGLLGVMASMTFAALAGPFSLRMSFDVFFSFAFIFLSVTIRVMRSAMTASVHS